MVPDLECLLLSAGVNYKERVSVKIMSVNISVVFYPVRSPHSKIMQL